MRRIAGVFAVIFGLALCWQLTQTYDGTQAGRVVIPLALAGLATYADHRRPFERWLPALSSYFKQHRYRVAAFIFALSVVYFYGSAWICRRAFHPTWHDDNMHAVQVMMLAKGYLWHAPHKLPEFFDTFHIFVDPVYAPIHFPGTAILNVAGVWLGLNWSVIPVLLASAGCALLFLILVEVVDGLGGVIGVICFWGTTNTRMLATMITSHNAMLMLGPLMVWLFLRWRKKPTLLRSAWLGLAVALAGFTRPVDALAYAVPIGIFVLYETLRDRRNVRRWAYIAVMIAVGLPLVGLQLAFDKAVTGKWLYPPYQAYNDRFHPYTSYGGVRERGIDAPPVKVSDLQQKQLYYEDFMLASARDFARRLRPN
ncbi:MAG: glycosyltransferase family 39 protein [Tepidisphaeraceae bacterium]